MKSEWSRLGLSLVTVFGLVHSGCSSEPGTSDPVTTGGVIVTGGVAATGGSVATGGVSDTGGLLATGGLVASGGVAETGGLVATGGAAETGGVAETGGSDIGDEDCCPDGECICRGDVPSSLSSAAGPYATDDYDLNGVGCVYFPTDAEPPFSAVAISDGYGGSGGCGRAQTSDWGPFYASHGIVAMIVDTNGGDQPGARGDALLDGIAGFKSENESSSSPLFGKLAGRYGTSGFSMGGGGTTHAASDDSTLLSSVGLMAWRPVGSRMTVPTLFICGASDGTASCGSHSEGAYDDIPDSTPKMITTVSGGHRGQPTAGGGDSGANALAFQKLYLDGDERWRPLVLTIDHDDTNIQ